MDLESFFPDGLQCKDYEYTHNPLTFSTSKIFMDSDLASKEATILCLFFYYQNLCLKRAQKCLLCKLLNWLAEQISQPSPITQVL